jgi:hypothetical protein
VGLIRKDPVNQRLLSITQLVRPLNSAAATDWALGMADRYDRAFDGNLAVDGEGAPQPRLGQILHDEIASGLDAEQGWLPVVRQLATQSDLINPVFAEGEGITLWQRGVLAAIKVISDVDDNTAMPAAEVPDHFEISLAKMAAD